MTHHELAASTLKPSILEVKNTLDDCLKDLDKRMFRGIGIRFSDYVDTVLHETTIFPLGIEQYILCLWISEKPLPAIAQLWLHQELKSGFLSADEIAVLAGRL